MRIKSFGLLVVLSVLISCAQATVNTEGVWADKQMWYQSTATADSSKIDVIYFVSTEVLSATDKNGNTVWQSQLADDDKSAMKGEIEWIEKNMFYGNFNLSAPYYHQFTFDAISQLNKDEFNSVYKKVAHEACESFDYYMKYVNKGRKYILAGFSQGAMLTLDVLKHMTDEQYSRLIACYTIGYRVSSADLEHPHIKAATGETDKGVVISFNSTQTLEAIWPMLTEGAATCINPINWKTDATPATFTFKETTNKVHVDEQHKVLIVETDNPTFYYNYYDKATFFEKAGVSRDNLHHWDLLFYGNQIHDNAIRRADSAGK